MSDARDLGARNPTAFPKLLRASRIAAIVAVLLAVSGVIVLLTMPPAIDDMRAPGWFDRESTRGLRSFIGVALLIVAFFASGVSAQLWFVSRRATLAAGTAILEQSAAAIARGVQSASPRAGATQSVRDRLAELERLKADGLVTEDEYERKRKELIAAL